VLWGELALAISDLLVPDAPWPEFLALAPE
jgi:hypothetical protein